MENTQVFWNLELKIKEGKMESLRSLASEMTDATKANEPETMDYIWSVDAKNSSCHIFESYTSSDAVRVHLGNFQAFGERFFDCLEIDRFQVYGYPDAALVAALGGLGATFSPILGGFSR